MAMEICKHLGQTDEVFSDLIAVSVPFDSDAQSLAGAFQENATEQGWYHSQGQATSYLRQNVVLSIFVRTSVRTISNDI